MVWNAPPPRRPRRTLPAITGTARRSAPNARTSEALVAAHRRRPDRIKCSTSPVSERGHQVVIAQHLGVAIRSAVLGRCRHAPHRGVQIGRHLAHRSAPQPHCSPAVSPSCGRNFRLAHMLRTDRDDRIDPAVDGATTAKGSTPPSSPTRIVPTILLHHHHFPSGHTVSGGREPPPPALLEPYVTVSRHTAPTVRRSSASVDLSAPPPKG